MPAWLRKMLITAGTSFTVMFIYMFFDPTLRDFLYAIILSTYLTVFRIVAQFVFKKGVVSVSAIAWERIFIVGGTALVRRFWINFFKKNTIEHVVKPLMPHTKKWFAAHLDDFKEQPFWLKFSETTVGVVVIGAIGYFIGFVSYIWTFIEKILTGKFQSFFLSMLVLATKFFGFIWSKISPWLDVIIITALIKFIKRIPYIQAFFHNTKKVKDKVVEHKNNAIHKVVHKPVKTLAKVIDGHAEKKIQKKKIKEGSCEMEQMVKEYGS